MSGHITEQKLKNRRFLSTEKSILKAYLLIRETLSLNRLIKTARISRSTLHRHHKNIYTIVPDYEDYFLSKYTKFAKRLIKIKYLRLKDIYEQTFDFLYKYQEIAEFLMQCGSQNIIVEALLVLEPKILATGKVASGEMFEIYVREVTSLIEAWQRNGFNKSEITVIVDKIMYLTNTARTRLSPLASFDHPHKTEQHYATIE